MPTTWTKVVPPSVTVTVTTTQQTNGVAYGLMAAITQPVVTETTTTQEGQEATVWVKTHPET